MPRAKKAKKTTKRAKRKVESMPGVIIEHISKENLNTEKEDEKSPKKNIEEIQTEKAMLLKKKIVLWSLVLFVGGVVFVMWILNVGNIFFKMQNAQKSDNNLLEQAKKDFKSTVMPALLASSESGENLINKLKEALAGLSTTTTLAVSEGSATSTLNTVTSTESNTVTTTDFTSVSTTTKITTTTILEE